MSKPDIIGAGSLGSGSQGKNFNRDFLLSVPPEALALLPSRTLSVSEFLNHTDYTPVARQSAIPQPVNFSFAPCDPNVHAIVRALRSRPNFPPLSVVKSLEAGLEAAWREGYQSIQDTFFQDYALPFWSLGFWTMLHSADKLRTEWMAVEEYIRSSKHRDEDISLLLESCGDRIRGHLRKLSWNEPILGFPALGWRPNFGSPTAKNYLTEGSADVCTPLFIQFFSNRFLNDEAINMMLHYIDLLVQRSEGLANKVVVANLAFTDRLLKEFSGKVSSSVSPSFLMRRYGELLTTLGREQLYFVVNPGKDHWAVFRVDVARRTIAYGDSLAPTRQMHKAAYSALTAWLKHLLGASTKFTLVSNLPCETQRDGFSCGIAACVTISSSIGFEDPWSTEKSRYLRMCWADRVMIHHTLAKPTAMVDTTNDLPEQSTGSKRLALKYILNDPEPQDNIVEATALSKTLEKSLSMKYDTASDSSSVHVLSGSDCGDPNVALCNSPALLVPPNSPPSTCFLPTDDLENDYSMSEPEESQRSDLLPPFDASGVLHFEDSDEDNDVKASSPPPPILAPRKHQRSISDDATAPVASSSTKRRVLSSVYEEKQSGPTGLSRSAQSDRAANEAYRNGTLEITPAQREKFLRNTRLLHPSARLDPEDTGCKRVWHGPCEKWITMDGPKRTKKYVEHVRNCKGKNAPRKNGKFTKAASGSLRIDTMFSSAASSAPSSQSLAADSPPPLSNSSEPPPPAVPCLGLRPEHDERINHLVGRDQLGGRRSQIVIARERFNEEFKNLSESQKCAVRMESNATAKWQVLLDPLPHVRSTQCSRECDSSASQIDTGPADVCQKCADVRFIREFQNALGRKPAPTENLKYVPFSHRNKQEAALYGRYVGLEKLIEQADSKRSPLMNYVTKIIAGEQKSPDILTGIIHVMAAKEDRLSRGKGMQGMIRPPSLVAFCQALLVTSPRGYNMIGKKLAFPEERNLRLHRSRAAGFPIGITDETISRVVEHLGKIEHTGPVCIACDDTQLLCKLSPYYDGQKQEWYLLGNIGEPIKIDDEVEGVEQQVIESAQRSELATKCRLWTMQVPTAGVPVFIVAAMPISSTFKAEDLLVFHNHLVLDLVHAGVCVVSYSTDGSLTERKVSSQFLKSAASTETNLIAHPRAGFPDIPITLHKFGPRSIPIVAIQDVKHAMKTARNNLFSGTRTLIIGNSPIYYLQILMLSVDSRSPLYQRDVLKVDRQDDRAATRIFSSAWLRHVVQISSEQSSGVPFKPAPLSIVSNNLPPPSSVLKHSLNAFIALLFILGEGFDAFQSRSLTILERIRMILRLFFFLELWKSSLQTLKYSETHHFLTQNLYQTLLNLVHSYMSLVFIYRDHLDHPNYSLCAWLHSTEGAEHTFGEARKARPDFTFSDFVTMVPKLEVMSMSAVSDGDDFSEAKARAAGYSHTLYSKLGINIEAMSNFPGGELIDRAAKVAYDEAVAVFSHCGIVVTEELCPPPNRPKTKASSTNKQSAECDNADYTAPPIHAWYEVPEELMGSDNDNRVQSEQDMVCDFAEEPPRLATELDTLLEKTLADHQWGTTAEFDNQIAAYKAANMALDLEERSKIADLNPSELFSHLISLRSEHETIFSKKAVRVGHTLKPEASITTGTGGSDSHVDDSTTSARSVLIQKVYSALKSIEGTTASTSGMARQTRIQGQAGVTLKGNAANAAEVAKARSKETLNVRVRAFNTAGLKLGCLMGTAGVTGLACIKSGSFAFVWFENQIWLAEIITMYSRGAGKGGNHGWANNVSNLTALSNIPVQLWEHWMASDFRSRPKLTAAHYAKRYAHIPSNRILYVVSSSERFEVHTDELIRLNSNLSTIWKGMSGKEEVKKIGAVVDGLLKRRRKAGGDGDGDRNDEDDDDEDD
ncbi:hypothetical protein FRC09_014080 [Ceratobasidium sp. 395]|nr:hypothetical protein FRC09_014080 [Ceratobasidium sp. 395]